MDGPDECNDAIYRRADGAISFIWLYARTAQREWGYMGVIFARQRKNGT